MTAFWQKDDHFLWTIPLSLIFNRLFRSLNLIGREVFQSRWHNSAGFLHWLYYFAIIVYVFQTVSVVCALVVRISAGYIFTPEVHDKWLSLRVSYWIIHITDSLIYSVLLRDAQRLILLLRLKLFSLRSKTDKITDNSV